MQIEGIREIASRPSSPVTAAALDVFLLFRALRNAAGLTRGVKWWINAISYLVFFFLSLSPFFHPLAAVCFFFQIGVWH